MEVWRSIANYEGLYEVSSHGRVRSLDGERWNGRAFHPFKGRELRLNFGGRYLCVSLSKDRKTHTYRVHELVAAQFLPSCPGTWGRGKGRWHIDHIDDNPLNNRADNLQWLTSRENVFVKPERQRNLLGQWA